MVLEKGDFVKINYTGRIKDTGEVFDTTSEKVAKEAGLYKEEIIFRPQPIVIGAGHVIKGLDEALVGLEVGEKIEIELPPEKAFGERDKKLIKTYRRKEFKKHGLDPYPGMVVEIEGKTGRVQSVKAGRVVVDFNSELAGKTVVYEINVEEKVNKLEEKIRLLLERHFPYANANDSDIKCEDSKTIIVLPDEVKLRSEAHLRKYMLAMEIFNFLEIEEVEYREIYRKKDEKKKEEQSEKET